MAVNLATKYSDKIAQIFTQESVVDGKTNKDYEFTGVRSIHIQTPITQPLNDYQKSGTNRYGTPTEMQDSDQELILTKDRSFSITIDKGNLTMQQNTKKSGQMLNAEIKEQVTPEMDKYALQQFADQAGKILALGTAPAKTDVVDSLNAGMTYVSNKKVPVEGRYIWIGWTNFGVLRTSSQWMGIDSLGGKALEKGELGLFMGARVIPVPDEYLFKGSTQCHFLIGHKSAIMQPKKIQDYFVKQDPPGINGALLEGRFIYDAFVLGAKADGIYAAVVNAGQQAAPTAGTYTAGTKQLILNSTGASAIKYTIDGADPRYSSSAKTIATGGNCDLSSFTTGATAAIKAVALSATLFTSNVAALTQTV